MNITAEQIALRHRHYFPDFDDTHAGIDEILDAIGIDSDVMEELFDSCETAAVNTVPAPAIPRVLFLYGMLSGMSLRDIQLANPE